MSPQWITANLRLHRFPRTRGDEPIIETDNPRDLMFSPHTRG